jgi:hypothetical protein
MNSWLRSATSRLWTSWVIAALAIPTPRGQSAKRLWVLQEPDQIVEYDLVTSAVVRSQTVPRRLVEHPEYLSINATGQMLFLPSLGAQWAAGDMATSADRAWFWDGRQAKEWKLEGPKTPGTHAGKPSVTETVRQWFLSAGGESLFWIEHKFEKIRDTLGVEHSVRTTAHVWRTSPSGDNPVDVATIAASGWCECTTGVCSESCPEWSFWAPNGIADDFFLATRMTEGQMGSTYHESVLYQHAGSRWVTRKMPQPLQAPLAASDKGEILVTAVPDAGCCGWENESSDQLLLLRSGKSGVLYDEQSRYNNRNYDVSFYASDARLSASNTLLAYTLASTARPGGEIRLSDDGKENAGELARVRRTIADLPTVEIVQLGTTPQTAAAIAHAGLVGWLSEREILVVQNGRLAIYDIQGIRRQDTTIRARSAADSFLR